MPESLANKHPGNMNHALWFTTDYRILRLYVATEFPDENLLIMLNFILKVYAKMWFRIKRRPQVHMLNALRDFNDSRV